MNNNPWGGVNKNQKPNIKMPDFSFLPHGINRSFLLLVLFGLYLVSGIFTVGPDEQAAVLRFSAWNRVAVPGLHYRLPWPFEDHKKVKVTVVNKTNNTTQQDSPDSYMLTGDFNILSVNFNVLWYVQDIRKFLFNDTNPANTIRVAAISVVREVVAKNLLQYIMTEGREKINREVQSTLQKMVEEYNIGIQIQQVELQAINPPTVVIDAFRDVEKARADKERIVNEAEKYRRRIIPAARADAKVLIDKSLAYSENRLADANSEIAKFAHVAKEYRALPEVSRKKMHLDAVRDLLGQSKTYLTNQNTSMVYLPFSGLNKNQEVVK